MLQKVITKLASPVVPFAVLPLLMIVLVAGTVAQRYIGLYDAQRFFFSSWGTGLLLGLVTLSLLCKFVFYSTWSWRKAGINLSHLGVLVLLVGGLLTAANQREGMMVIPEGQSASIVSDYHARELTISVDDKTVAQIPAAKLKPGFKTQGLPIALTILESCRNCGITGREDESGKRKGMARMVVLEPKAPEARDEENLYGLTFSLSGLSEEQDGTYIAFDIMPKPLEFEKDDKKITIIYGRQERALPFTLELVDFKKQDHPGTMMARAYSSELIVHDGKVKWPVLVEMNKPLRYKGYTVFQSSFIEAGTDNEATVLAVVKNSAWLFPYIGTGIMALGLLLHWVLALRTGRRAS